LFVWNLLIVLIEDNALVDVGFRVSTELDNGVVDLPIFVVVSAKTNLNVSVARSPSLNGWSHISGASSFITISEVSVNQNIILSTFSLSDELNIVNLDVLTSEVQDVLSDFAYDLELDRCGVVIFGNNLGKLDSIPWDHKSIFGEGEWLVGSVVELEGEFVGPGCVLLEREAVEDGHEESEKKYFIHWF